MIVKDDSILIREALEEDIPAVYGIFEEVYKHHYPHYEFCQENWLKRSVFNDNVLMLVAEDIEKKEILGTASVLFDTGAHSDLVGEFGRLVVLPEARERGVGRALMQKRVEYVQNRLHVGLVENRCVHTYSQRISQAHGFAAVGFLPQKLFFQFRESVALFARHFGDALVLRCNHPRIIPEAYALSHYSLENCGLPLDPIVDEDSLSYPPGEDYVLEELTSQGVPSLIRIERGRLSHREVFGPMGLQYGFFRLQAQHATYLVAREKSIAGKGGPVVGAIGYLMDEKEKLVRVIELITRSDTAIRFLLEQLLENCRNKWHTQYVEVDVSAYAPRMQRTLLELGFLPAAYIPAMVFHNVERLDVIKMVKLLTPLDIGETFLIPSIQVIADNVIRSFVRQKVLPDISAAVSQMSLFKGLNEEQSTRLASVCSLANFGSGKSLFLKGEPAEQMYILINGKVRVVLENPNRTVGTVKEGESVGEISFLTGENHSATATAEGLVSTAVLTVRSLNDLIRQRPDIALVLYQNLAKGLGRKLQRTDITIGKSTC